MPPSGDPVREWPGSDGLADPCYKSRVTLLRGLAILTLLGQAPTAVFEIELWPGEGRPRFQAVAKELVVREMPSASARIVRRLGVTRGQNIAFDQTRFRTTEAGQLLVLSGVNVTGRVIGTIRLLTRDAYYKGQFARQSIALKEGDVVAYLQYRAEGTCFVRVVDQVIDADPCPAEDARAFRVVTQPKTEWWIRIVKDRAPLGWVMVDEKTVKQSGRSF